MTIADTLTERAKTYGDFRDIAKISGALQRTMRATRNWDALPEDAREALQTIASKIARILNGDPEFVDSWHDIAGYAMLVENRLRQTDAKIAEGAERLAARLIESAPPLATPPEGVTVWYDPKSGVEGLPWKAKGPGGTAQSETRDGAVDAVVSLRSP